MGSVELLRMENISMEFPGVLALSDVHFDLRRGEVHVLLGENGAGKSTLMKILCGVHKRKGGEIYYKGEKFEPIDVHHTQEAGISIIYQELNLVSHLSVAENIFIGAQPKGPLGIDWNKMYRNAQAVLDELHVDINPRTLIKNLGVAQQQMVEVAKALTSNVDILIMDEPTSSLTDKEIKELFRTINDLKAKGVGIIYISHRLEEIQEIGDRATVFRDGQFVETLDFKEKEVDLNEIIKLMVGRDLTEKFPKETVPIGDELFRAENITSKLLKDCSFSVKSGEILGIAGLMGAGRTELMRAITGADKRTGGEVYMRGEKLTIKSFRDAVKYKIGFLTEDRKTQGLVLIFSVASNITLAGLDKICRYGALSLKAEKEIAQKMIGDIRIKTPSLRQRVVNLSGGNQQKVVLAKWLFTECDLLIFDEPTRGIDVGAKVEIYKLMVELVKKGAAIIMVSSELPEILGMSDRVIVMHEGKISGEYKREDATQEKILHAATGGQ